VRYCYCIVFSCFTVPTIGGAQIFNTQTGILADAVVNTGFRGMILGAGGTVNALTTPILGPSGSISTSAGSVVTGDTLYWVAGKSTYGAYNIKQNRQISVCPVFK